MSTSGLNRLNVLIVEDNLHMGRILQAMLLGFGISRTKVCTNAEDGLLLIQEQVFDIIFLDYQMPILDGVDFARLVRTADDSTNTLTPIIMITAFTERWRVCAARDAGVNEVCAKPLSGAQLYAKIAAVVNEPRPFIRSKDFFGPDRRRKDEGPPKSGERRASRLAEMDDQLVEDGEDAPEEPSAAVG